MPRRGMGMGMGMTTNMGITMAPSTPEPPPSAHTLLRLMWLASPALPVGGFSYSEGLEAAVQAGRVHDEASTAQWLSDHLHLVMARSEMPLLVRALRALRALPALGPESQGEHEAPGDRQREIQACNDWILQTRESREFRLQTEQMGRSLAQWMSQLRRETDPAPAPAVGALPGGPTWPVAFALACDRAGATPTQALLALAFSWAENQVQAAIKCVPLGQAAGQRMLARLAHEIEAVVSDPAPQPVQAFAPGLAILSAQHEDQYSRLFRS